MKHATRTSVGIVAAALSIGFGVGVSAQYAGWTIPDTAKTDKSPVKVAADAAKKGSRCSPRTAPSATARKAKATAQTRTMPPTPPTSSASN